MYPLASYICIPSLNHPSSDSVVLRISAMIISKTSKTRQFLVFSVDPSFVCLSDGMEGGFSVLNTGNHTSSFAIFTNVFCSSMWRYDMTSILEKLCEKWPLATCRASIMLELKKRINIFVYCVVLHLCWLSGVLL